ncbi:MAG: VPLPA-CTERM sorting domain-containing protein [Paracoccaceae bacterium]
MNLSSAKTAIAAGLMTVSASMASAGVIDLTGFGDNGVLGGFGNDVNRYYAQSVQADDLNWASLQFGLGSFSGGTFNLSIVDSRVEASLPGTGTAPDANNVLFTTNLTVGDQGTEIFNVALDVAVTAGSTYFMVFDSVGESLANAFFDATKFGGSDKYADGEIIFSGEFGALSNSMTWFSSVGQNDRDLAFIAEFNGAPDVAVVPLPAAFPILLTGLAALGFVGRRRRKS